MSEVLADQLFADRAPIPPKDHQVTAMSILSLEAVCNHFELTLIQQDQQPVGGSPREIGFDVALWVRQLRRIDAGDPDSPVA